jgi:hypothetical protein
MSRGRLGSSPHLWLNGRTAEVYKVAGRNLTGILTSSIDFTCIIA